MKKFFVFLTAFILSTNLVFAVDISKLYNLKASDIQKVKKSTLSFNYFVRKYSDKICFLYCLTITSATILLDKPVDICTAKLSIV